MPSKRFKHTEESKKKMSITRKGQVPWCAGKKLSEAHKESIGSWFRGRKQSPDQQKRLLAVGMNYRFKKGESESGASVFDQFVSAGMTRLAKSSRDLDGRVVRIATLLEPSCLFQKHPVTGKNLDTGWPRLFLTEDCLLTVQEIEEWEWSKTQSDSKDPLEKPEMKDDHGIDALGYVLVKVTSKAPLDFDSERMYEVSKEKELDDYKREWCAGVMSDNQLNMGRPNGTVF